MARELEVPLYLSMNGLIPSDKSGGLKRHCQRRRLRMMGRVMLLLASKGGVASLLISIKGNKSKVCMNIVDSITGSISGNEIFLEQVDRLGGLWKLYDLQVA